MPERPHEKGFSGEMRKKIKKIFKTFFTTCCEKIPCISNMLYFLCKVVRKCP